MANLWEAAPAAEQWFGAEAGVECQWWFNLSRAGARSHRGRPYQGGRQLATHKRHSDVTSADRAACSGSVVSWVLA